MARDAPDPDAEEERTRLDWRSVVREVVIAGIIVGVVFGGIFAYTQVYPPLVVVESSSMQHSRTTSYVGVIDTGDLVLVQAARGRPDVVTWIEGKVSGHATYGDFGDVIVFRKPTAPSDATPVIHRALLYVVPSATGPDAYDIPDLRAYPSIWWEGADRNGTPIEGDPVGLSSVTIHRMGWRGDLGITFDLEALAANPINRRAGFITMGDNNAYDACEDQPDPCPPASKPYDSAWVVPIENVIGRARGEIAWFGLLKLTYQPTFVRIAGAVAGVVLGVLIPRTNRNVILVAAALAGAIAGYFVAGLFDTSTVPLGACCSAWGDPLAPRNSWDSLLIALPLVFASPLLFEAGLWAWARYVRPRVRRWRGLPDEAAADAPESR
jgi:signal peptidase